MALSLAYSKTHTSGAIGAAGHAHQEHRSHPTHWINKQIRVGTRVLVDRSFGKVVGYNIAGFGMWVGALYPLVVELEDGTVMRCKPCEITPLPASDTAHH